MKINNKISASLYFAGFFFWAQFVVSGFERKSSERLQIQGCAPWFCPILILAPDDLNESTWETVELLQKKCSKKRGSMQPARHTCKAWLPALLLRRRARITALATRVAVEGIASATRYYVFLCGKMARSLLLIRVVYTQNEIVTLAVFNCGLSYIDR